MLPGLLAAAALAHSYHTAKDGVVTFDDHPDTGRIVFLQQGEVIKINVTGVDSIVATPALKDVDSNGYQATCLGGTVTPPQPHVTHTLEAYFQIPISMPWRKEDVTAVDCIEVLEIRGNETMLVFLGDVDRWTFADLMDRGVAVFDLHERWNDALFTYPLSLASAAVVVAASFWLSSAYGGPTVALESKPRFYLYVAAISAFTAAALEGIIHTGIAQFRLPFMFGLSFFEALAVVTLPNLAAIAIILAIVYAPWNRKWALLELLTAFSMFLFFYAGLYLGPALWMCAALVRVVEPEGYLYK